MPEPATHGEHKAATLIALNAVNELPADSRLIILGAMTRNKTDTVFKFDQYENYLQTQTLAAAPKFEVDRTTGFSYPQQGKL